MNVRLVVWVTTLAGCLAVPPPPLHAQEVATPTFRTSVLLTELDVIAHDAAGRLVEGLTPDDFEVVEDGTTQTVDSIEFIDVEAAVTATEGRPSGIVSNAYRRTSRVWIVVVDDLRLGRALRGPVRDALATLVAGLSPDDLVALVPTSGRKESRVEFTRDKPTVLSAVNGLRFSEAGVGQVRSGDRSGATDVTNNRMPSALVGSVGGGADNPAAGDGTQPMLQSPDMQAEASDDRLLTTLADVSTMAGQTSASRVVVVLVSTGLPVTVHPEALRTLDQKDLLEGLRKSELEGGGFARMRPWEPGIQRERRMQQTVRLIMTAQRGSRSREGVAHPSRLSPGSPGAALGVWGAVGLP